VADLRAIAAAAYTGDHHPWEWTGVGEHGYPQQILQQGDVVLIAECYEGPDHPSSIAEFIATFDPPTVTALLDLLAAFVEVEKEPCRFDHNGDCQEHGDFGLVYENRKCSVRVGRDLLGLD
jgi:hypothetical protein